MNVQMGDRDEQETGYGTRSLGQYNATVQSGGPGQFFLFLFHQILILHIPIHYMSQ